MHLRDPLLIFFSCRIVGGLQFVPRKCFTHKATRKPVLKPNHYGATYDYNTEWVWCEKFLKQSVFVTVNRALPFRLLTFRLYPGIVSGIWPLVLHLLLDDMESHSCSFQEETCHRDPLPQQSRSPPHPLKSWRQDPQWHHLHGSRQSPWWQKWRQTFSGWLSHQHVKHSQPLQDESFPRSFGTAGGYKFVPSPALASEALAATAHIQESLEDLHTHMLHLRVIEEITHANRPRLTTQKVNLRRAAETRFVLKLEALTMQPTLFLQDLQDPCVVESLSHRQWPVELFAGQGPIRWQTPQCLFNKPRRPSIDRRCLLAQLFRFPRKLLEITAAARRVLLEKVLVLEMIP